jgi:cyclopropane fatty-acyl-phospholipid synthase-like methyltransferase
MNAAIFQVVNEFFTRTINQHGPTPKGVDWNSEAAQEVRFEQLLKILPEDGSHSLNDYGCGYGALLNYCLKHGLDVDYVGFDIVEAMIKEAVRTHDKIERARFIYGQQLTVESDYTVASGVFNLKGPIPDETWTQYVCDTLEKIDRLSKKGFAFNLLTKYSDAEKMRSDLYYGDPCFYFDLCKRLYARNIALLHNYRQYEFTILVHKEI